MDQGFLVSITVQPITHMNAKYIGSASLGRCQGPLSHIRSNAWMEYQFWRSTITLESLKTRFNKPWTCSRDL
ncbi:Uncharacterized protein HZ326_23575 [Fusarium oxysporum f. sp. albedinis]|nr:Uncharacterized protein HZ326_23575 [Fusarium oxysporum f. sp. albedinis]